MATAAKDINNRTYIFKSQAREMLGVGQPQLDHLIEKGVLGVRQIPGSHTRVKLSDIQALIDASTRPATLPGA